MRAPFHYYGGKGRLVRRLLPWLPPHTVYVEPFCGAASLFFAKRPSPVEVLNDLNGEIITLFRVLQDRESFEALQHRLLHTPYSYAEFCRALEIMNQPDASPLDRAWAWMVRQNQGFGGEAKDRGGWGRVFTSAQGVAETVNNWLMRLALLPDWHRRLLMVQLDQRDALEVIRYWDGPKTFFYCDPPYVHGTRAAGNRNDYAYELSDDQHQALLDVLVRIEGQAMVSGYDHPLYRALDEAGYRRMTIETACHAAVRSRASRLRGRGSASAHVPRTEVVWLKTRRPNLLAFTG